MGDRDRHWTVQIIDTKKAIDFDKSKYVYYNILVIQSPGDTRFHLARRYRQFRALHLKVRVCGHETWDTET